MRRERYTFTFHSCRLAHAKVRLGVPFALREMTSHDTGKLGQPCRMLSSEGVVLKSKWVVV